MELERWLHDQLSQPSALASFDTSTTLVRALSSYLHGTDFPALGLAPRFVAPLVPLGNYLPQQVRTTLYQRGSANEAIDPDELGDVDIDDIREWVTDRYPRRGYPAVVLGSANGAGIHLAALLGIPWLPQTFLIPVRRSIDEDDPRADYEWAKEPGQVLLEGNPDLAIYQMNDPNQDRLPISEMAYFRVKCLGLGEAYREFLRTVLAPGGTILLSECTLEWPSTKVADRHFFQFGCIGGLDPEDYYEGSEQVERFLASENSSRRTWNPPEPDGERPEAEWGFRSELGEDAVEFAETERYQIRRLRYNHPRDMSPLVAELYREQYEQRGFDADRLVVDTFTQMDLWWTLRTGSVPFWLSFNSAGDADAIERYLDDVSDPYEELYLTLFSHGVDSTGIADADRWRSVLARADRRGEFLGVDPQEFPIDFGSYVRYNTEFSKTISARRPLLDPLSLDGFERFVDEHESQFSVELLDE